MHRIIVDAGYFFTLQIGSEARWAAFDIRRALEREHHIVGREWRSIVELHAFAQLEFPGRVVDGLPGHGQPRAQTLLFVGHDQSVKDDPSQGIVGAQIVEMRVDGRRLGFQADSELSRGAYRGRHGHQRRGQSGDGQFQESHCSTPLVWIVVIKSIPGWRREHTGCYPAFGTESQMGPDPTNERAAQAQERLSRRTPPSPPLPLGRGNPTFNTRAEPTPCLHPTGTPAGAGRAIGIVPAPGT